MKNIITTLVISIISLSVFGQVPFQQKAANPSDFPAKLKVISNSQINAIKNNRVHATRGSRGIQQYLLDYDAVDEIATVDSGGAYTRGLYALNSNYDQHDTNRYGLTWAFVAFDTLYDANTLTAVPISSTPITIDSLDVYFTHDNNTGMPDTIQVSVYKWQGPFGILPNGPENEITNQKWYDTLIITTTSLAPINNPSLGRLVIKPNLSLPSGTKFSVGVHFYGDTSRTNSLFTILTGSGNRCGGVCLAYPSVFELNSYWRIIAWSGQNNLTGVNSIVAECNNNNVPGEPEECELWDIQNVGIAAYLTIDPILTSAISSGSTICPGDEVTLSVSPAGGTGPYDVYWTPTTGLATPFSPSTTATIDTTITYTATIIDASPDTITKTVTITVKNITIDAGADQNIACGETTALNATAGGTLTGATFSWSNGIYTLNNPNVGQGSYTITATNSFGCSTSDAVDVIIPGVIQELSFTIGPRANNIGCKDSATIFTNTSHNLTGWDWTWSFGDGSGNTALAESPSYTYGVTGTFTVSLSADSSGCSVAPATKNVTIQNCIDGIEETWLSKHVEMYPNPTTGVVTLSFKDLTSQSGVVGIYDVTGKLAIEEPLSVAGNSQKVINLAGLAEGVYFVKVQLGNDVMMKKLNVTR